MMDLRELSALTAQPFSSSTEAINAILDLMYKTLGLRTPFVARTDQERFEVVAVTSHDGCPLEVGASLPLPESY